MSTFCIAFHIFVIGEHRDFKFDTQIDLSNSHPTNDKPPMKGDFRYVQEGAGLLGNAGSVSMYVSLVFASRRLWSDTMTPSRLYAKLSHAFLVISFPLELSLYLAPVCDIIAYLPKF